MVMQKTPLFVRIWRKTQLPTIRGTWGNNLMCCHDSFFSFPRCQSLTEDASAQCACWINQTRVIDKIKEFKCQAKSTQKKVTQFKVIILWGAIHFIIWINRISALTPSKSVKRRRISLWSLSTSACTTTAWSLSTKLLSHWVRWEKSLHSYLILIKL